MPTIVFCLGANAVHNAPEVMSVLERTEERTLSIVMEDVVTVSMRCGTRVWPLAGRPLEVPRVISYMKKLRLAAVESVSILISLIAALLAVEAEPIEVVTTMPSRTCVAAAPGM
jgi:hypothetical protein